MVCPFEQALTDLTRGARTTRSNVQEFSLRKLLFFVAAMAGASSWALAQPLASDPSVPVPSVDYLSVFDSPKVQAKPAPKAVPSTPLSPEQALQLALLKQPALFSQPYAPGLERAEIQAAFKQLTHSVYRDWIEAVAAQQSLGTVREVHEAAQTAAELAQRMVKAGNWSKVPLLQAQVLASSTATQVAQAQVQAVSAREKMLRRLGLWGSQIHIDLPQQLPKLPDTPQPWADSENLALHNKLELASAAFNARLAQAKTNPLDVLELQKTLMEATTPLTVAGTKTLEFGHLSAPTLPRNRASTNPALINAVTEQAHADRLAANIRSEAREAWFRYRTAWDLARHQRDVVLPLSTALQEETQLRYNGMLQSTWDLLASARARLESVNAAQQALSDFWLAHTDLQAVVAGIDVTFSASSGPGNSGSNPAQGH